MSMKEIETKFDFAHRIANIMETYDKEDYCKLHYYMETLHFLDDREGIYVVVSALIDVLNAIKRESKPSFDNIEQYSYEYDAYDEIDFDDYEDYMENNFTITETRTKIRSKELVHEQLSELNGLDSMTVKELLESYKKKDVAYNLVNRIEYALQLDKKKGE